MQLCGSHLHFYACYHRGDRGGAFDKPDATPCAPGYRAGDPYECLACPSAHHECKHADHDGAKHATAGIEIRAVR